MLFFNCDTVFIHGLIITLQRALAWGGKSSDERRRGRGWSPRFAENTRLEADTRESQDTRLELILIFQTSMLLDTSSEVENATRLKEKVSKKKISIRDSAPPPNKKKTC